MNHLDNVHFFLSTGNTCQVLPDKSLYILYYTIFYNIYNIVYYIGKNLKNLKFTFKPFLIMGRLIYDHSHSYDYE